MVDSHFHCLSGRTQKGITSFHTGLSHPPHTELFQLIFIGFGHSVLHGVKLTGRNSL